MSGFVRRYRATIIAACVLAAVLAVCIAVSRSLTGGGEGGLVALVHDGDGNVHALDLSRDGELTVSTSLGTNTVVVENGAVRMVEADCPHGDCLRQVPITRPGQQIICLPHELWIEIVTSGDDAGEMDSDAVAYDDGVDTVAR